MSQKQVFRSILVFGLALMTYALLIGMSLLGQVPGWVWAVAMPLNFLGGIVTERALEAQRAPVRAAQPEIEAPTPPPPPKPAEGFSPGGFIPSPRPMMFSVRDGGVCSQGHRLYRIAGGPPEHLISPGDPDWQAQLNCPDTQGQENSSSNR